MLSALRRLALAIGGGFADASLSTNMDAQTSEKDSIVPSITGSQATIAVVGK